MTRFLSFFNRATRGRPNTKLIQKSWRMKPLGVRLRLEELESRITPSYYLKTLASFSVSDYWASRPTGAPLVLDSTGNAYGMAVGAGAYLDGAVFEVAKGSGVVTTLVTFNGSNGIPNNGDGLTMDAAGNLYGTTESGGDFGGGTVFEIAAGSGQLTTLASFGGSNPGWAPTCTPAVDGNGNIFGTTQGGGTNSAGSIWELPKGSSTIINLSNFVGGSSTGYYPVGPVILEGNYLYGTTPFGTNDIHSGPGAGVFRLDVTNPTNPTPIANIYLADDIIEYGGSLYVINETNGLAPYGSVYKLDLASNTLTDLFDFNATDGSAASGLAVENGNVIGTNGAGNGTVFQLIPGNSATYTTLATFDGTSEGSGPSELVSDGSGNFYGVTGSGGGFGYGTVFELSPTHFSVTSLPSTTAGNALSVTVTAQDPNNNTDTSYTGTIHFTSSDPQAVLPADYTFTAADAAVHSFSVALKTAGSQSVTATDTVTSGTGTDSPINVTPATAKTLQVAGFPSPTTAGVSQSFTVTAFDPYGNIATGYTGTVHFTSTDKKAVLPGNYTFLASDTGVHTFSATLKTAGTQAITATDTVTKAITGSESGIIVNPAAASRFIVSAPASSVAGAAFSITVTAFDPFGNIATGYTGTVHFTSSDKKAALPANYTFTGGDAGVHTFSHAVALVTAGSQTVTATDTTTATINGKASIKVSAAAVDHFKITAIASTTAGNAVTVTVTAQDAFNNTVTSYLGTIYFTSSDPQAVLPPDYTFTATDKGVHTFSSGVILKTAGTQMVTATDTATSTVAGHASIMVKPGLAAMFSINAPSSVTAGVAFTFTVTALDAFGNVATGYVGTVHFISSDAAASLPENFTFLSSDAGVESFVAIFNTPGTESLTATDTLNPTITGSDLNIQVM